MRQLKVDISKCNYGRDCKHECEESCIAKVLKLSDRSCAALTINSEKGLISLCEQCGDCAVICPSDALTRNKLGVITINKNRCVGCYMCVGFCQQNVFKRHKSRIEPYKCNACGICVKACPKEALTIVDVPTPAPRII